MPIQNNLSKTLNGPWAQRTVEKGRTVTTQITSRSGIQANRRDVVKAASVTLGAAALGSSQIANVAAEDKVTVKFFLAAGESEEAAWKALVDGFNAQSESINVEMEIVYAGWDEMYRKLRGYMTAGDTPQIVRHRSTEFIRWAESGDLVDLKPLIERDSLDIDAFFPAPIEALTLDDQLFGLPPGIYVAGWFYNRGLFAEAGIEAPTSWEDAWSFEELQSAVATLTSGEGPTKKFGIAITSDVNVGLHWLWSNNADFISDDRTESVLAEEAAIESLELRRALTLDDGVAPKPADVQTVPETQLMSTGRVGIFESGPWSIPTMEESGIDWGIMPMAKGNGESATPLFIDFFGIHASSQFQDEAWEVLKYFTSPEGEEILMSHGIAGIPARREVADRGADEILRRDGAVWMESIDLARGMNLIANYAEAEAAFQTEYELMMLGEQSAEDMATRTADQVNKIIAE